MMFQMNSQALSLYSTSGSLGVRVGKGAWSLTVLSLGFIHVLTYQRGSECRSVHDFIAWERLEAP